MIHAGLCAILIHQRPPVDSTPTSPLRMFSAIAVALAGIITTWAVVEFFLLRGETLPIPAESSETESVASLEMIRLGGVDQWILIRGTNLNNPLLLFLHGSSGVPLMPLAHAFQSGLENFYVVVQWDRPGTGKSRDITAARTFPAILNDIHQLSEMLLKRFGQERLFLVGHSGGGVLGLQAVADRPELYAAFIGTGQWTPDSLACYVAQRRFLFNMGRAHGDRELVRRLMRGESDLDTDLFRYGAGIRGSASDWPVLLTALRAPEYDLSDILSMVQNGSSPALPAGVIPSNYEVPIFFLLGRHDYIAPSLLAAELLDGFRAPFKELVWFEYSAHFPFWEEQRKFTAEMIRIRDVVVSQYSQNLR